MLQSLTVLDEGGGRIAGVNYNSTTPLAEQLKTLSLGMTDDPTSTELFQRAARTAGGGAGRAGRRDYRAADVDRVAEREGGPGDDADTTIDKFYLTLVATSGAVRVIELTPALSVRPLDARLQGQLDRYLELLSTTHSTGLRHLTLDALGQGQRQLRVSYISEVPVWKSTYRMVFPREANGNAIVQGWAVVDNTVGADWDNVQLSLVAGAPQSFIQPLSQPLYTRRPEIPIATGVETTPQTHEAAEVEEQDRLRLRPGLLHGIGSSYVRQADSFRDAMAKLAALGRLVELRRDGSGHWDIVQSLPVSRLAPALAVGGLGWRRLPPHPMPLHEGDVSTNAFDDFFEYALTAPVTIHKNESAMVPILQQELPAEHVTLWSEEESTPLRAVWLENKSKLTLDSGSFSIFESGEFVGEGLLDPIHPGEKRLLSYAADQALRMKVTARDNRRILHHVKIGEGSVVETYMNVASVTYSAANSGDVDRVVLIEHPRGNNSWTLEGDLKAAETTPNLYRLKLPVAAHSTGTLEVREHGPVNTSVTLNSDYNQTVYLLDLINRAPGVADKLKPVIDAQAAVAELDRRMAETKKSEDAATADEARDRENLTALKGNDAGKRFVDELNRAEDQLQTTQKQMADLEQQKEAAVTKLNELIAGISFDWDVK